MSIARCFPPIADSSARVLILGSMPGVASLDAAEYYAHPRNAFWPIMGQLLGFDPALPYQARCERLRAASVAVWDVLRQCVRPGSLDSDIQPASEVANDLPQLLADCPRIELVAFNGHKALTAFHRHVLSSMEATLRERLTLVRLPSTSPAHAARTLEEKLAAWRDALRVVRSPD